MQTQRSGVSKKPNSRERQSRAIVNLRELSETPWNATNDQKVAANPSLNLQKIHVHTIQSIQLPLNPKQINPQVKYRDSHRPFLSLNQNRPNTIHHYELQQSPLSSRQYQNKPQPFTSINFYENIKNVNNSFDKRSRLNEEIEFFTQKIKQQQRNIRSIQDKRAKSVGIKLATNTLPFRANIAKKSFFYKQIKNILSESFKVDGKPVQIKWDKYSLQAHGLPKKKSIYTFKQPNTQNVSFINKTEQLFKKVQRYSFNQNQGEKIQFNFVKRKSNSLYDDQDLTLGHRTLHARTLDSDSKKKTKGKLCLGRPPTKLIVQDD